MDDDDRDLFQPDPPSVQDRLVALAGWILLAGVLFGLLVGIGRAAWRIVAGA